MSNQPSRSASARRPLSSPADVSALIARLQARTAKVGVIGLGYVGLPLAVEFADAGLHVLPVDVDQTKVDSICQGRSYIPDVDSDRLKRVVDAGRLRATTDFGVLAEVDAISICVPTPLRKTKDPDLSYVVAAVEAAARHLRRGQLVVLESTTYPGTTEEVVRPMLERGGLVAGRDFFLAFSPERVDPGNPQWHTGNTPKVVGGIDAASTEAACALYGTIVSTTVPVSSTGVAEMVKLLENTFRAVNIGMANELALMCRHMGIDVWEVIDAARTKPFGFMAFYPGPGLGGHCIPIDPFYLSWKARQSGFESRFIELAGHINGAMPRHVIDRVSDALNTAAKPIKGSRVHLLGMAYKANVGDYRESPAIDIARLLEQRGAIVSYSDPHVPAVDEHGFAMLETPLDVALTSGIDCAVIVTDHRDFDYQDLVKRAPLVVDTRNALKGVTASHISRL
ncbi:MAG: nucleotide sugar dehydrogenase [Vicinamibacteria bacterium]|nr:nucleotide sugar dehydrogenase [Vicinamibacteria bacterium]